MQKCMAPWSSIICVTGMRNMGPCRLVKDRILLWVHRNHHRYASFPPWRFHTLSANGPAFVYWSVLNKRSLVCLYVVHLSVPSVPCILTPGRSIDSYVPRGCCPSPIKLYSSIKSHTRAALNYTTRVNGVLHPGEGESPVDYTSHRYRGESPGRSLPDYTRRSQGVLRVVTANGTSTITYVQARSDIIEVGHAYERRFR